MKFRKTLIGAGLLMVSVIGVALAQTIPIPLVASMSNTDAIQVVPKSTPQAQSQYASALQLRSWILGQNTTNGTPVLTTTTSVCGGATAAIVGSNYTFSVTEGTTASTSCVVTFNPAFVTAPVCQASLNNVVDAAFKIATTATTLTATQTSASSNVLNVICMGQVGG